jgi:hypothetical protein
VIFFDAENESLSVTRLLIDDSFKALVDGTLDNQDLINWCVNEDFVKFDNL